MMGTIKAFFDRDELQKFIVQDTVKLETKADGNTFDCGFEVKKGYGRLPGAVALIPKQVEHECHRTMG